MAAVLKQVHFDAGKFLESVAALLMARHLESVSDLRQPCLSLTPCSRALVQKAQS